MKKTREEQEEQVVALRKIGESFESICAKTGLKYNTARHICARNGIVLTSGQRATNLRKFDIGIYDQIIDLRRKGNNYREVSSALNLKHSYVRKVFKKFKKEFVIDREKQYRTLAENEGWELIGPYVSSNVKMKYKCPNQHTRFISPNSFQQGNRCRICFDASKKGSRRPTTAKYTWNDVIEKSIFLKWVFLDADKVVPTEKVYDTCGKTWNFKCVCERDITPRLADVMLGKIISCGCLKSKAELELDLFIKTFCSSEMIFHDRQVLDGLEIDLYYPLLSIGIEYSGVYYHGEKCNEEEAKNKQFEKFRRAQLKGVRLITIFESEWIFKRAQVEAYLFTIFKGKTRVVGASKCKVKKIENVEIVKDFLDQNHIQGASSLQTGWGLYFKDELVSVGTFVQRKNQYEMTRFCNKMGTSVPGGFTRILSAFKKSQTVKTDIYTFSDNRWSLGALYSQNGFIKVADIAHSYHYFKAGRQGPLEHKSNYRKAKIKERWPDADLTKTEWELMFENKYDRIWDCGKVKWLLKP
jgi:hypothetical protein